MIHDGRFLQSEFTFGNGESKTTGTGIVGFETQTGLFTSVWTDSRSTRMSLRQSKDKFNGEVLICVRMAEGLIAVIGFCGLFGRTSLCRRRRFDALQEMSVAGAAIIRE